MAEDDKKGPAMMDVVEPPEPEMGVWEKWKSFPKTVFCIFGNEFCERFSYYGMRTVLTLYLVNILNFEEANAIATFHGFVSLCYFTPLLGSILADGYIGKFHTILWVSLFYAAGNIVLAVAACFQKGSSVHPALDIVGLIIIAFGTGGIKPCVAAFGGDQFKKGQERLLEAYFSIFYFSINAGSVISTFVTPIIRVQPCLESDTCFPAAFGLPAGLMVIAVICFAIGTPFYRRLPIRENIIAEVCKAMHRALSNKRNFKIKRDHWMDHYMDNHECHIDSRCTKTKCHKQQFVDDIKALLRVCVMFLPIPVFWALFDQQGSVWVLQGVAMNGMIAESFTLLPDQMGTLNALLILAFIPIFQGLVYPAIRWCGINPTPLRRMSTGGFVAAAAFVIAMFVQLKVNLTLPVIPNSNEMHQAFVNPYPCRITIHAITPYSCNGDDPCLRNFTINPNDFQRIQRINPGGNANLTWRPTTTDSSCTLPPVVTTPVMKGKSMYSVLVPTPPGLPLPSTYADQEKSETGEGQFKISISHLLQTHQFPDFGGVFFWCLAEKGADPAHVSCAPKFTEKFAPSTPDTTPWAYSYAELKPSKDKWALWYGKNSTTFNLTYTAKEGHWWKKESLRKGIPTALRTYSGITFTKNKQGGIYTITLTNNATGGVVVSNQRIADDNSVTLLLQVPQYVVITAAEILISITGLEFSYSQAPLSMKSVVQAVWLLTVAVGDLLVLAIAEARIFANVAWTLLLFAGLMVAVIGIFMALSIFWYKYTYYVAADDDLVEEEETNLDEEKQ